MTQIPETWTIQEVARRSGFSEPTLRYYEKIGLIDAVPRDASSGHRRYSAAAVQVIEALACLRTSGMSVADMRAYLQFMARGRDAATQQRMLFEANAARVTAEIARLQVRQRYLSAKAELWAARECGDVEREALVAEQLQRLTLELKDGNEAGI